MRGKKAKALRRIAEARTPGAPLVRYSEPRYHWFHPSTVNMKKCTRLAYQLSKRFDEAEAYKRFMATPG